MASTAPRITRKTASALIVGMAAAAGLVFAAASFTPSSQPPGWVAPPEVSSYSLVSGEETVFQTDYDRDTWSGNLYAYPVDASGVVDRAAERWSGGAAANIDEQNYDTGRKIVTMKSDGSRIPFRWASLASAQQTAIGDATNGPKILNYVRGDRSNENPNGTKLRARKSVLGDIIHSRPYYIASATRPIIYVGVNDGMLHAIDAASGEEVYAYVPSMLIPTLKSLAPVAPTAYSHTYYVDASPNAGQVVIGGATRTVLVGGLGAGGKGLWALDITDDATGAPASETAAAARILWEITPTTVNNAASTAYASLGHTYAVPSLARLNSGQTAVVVGNGYNNTGTGRAVLYLIDAANGALIRAIDTGSGSTASPNGLSTPVAIDADYDGKADWAYAGDIDGNLWKFDLTSTSASTWSATKVFTTSPAQAITGAPAVTAHPYGGFMVNFGTGRLFTTADTTDTTVFHVYGIWDGAPSQNDALLTQAVTEQSWSDGTTTRRVRTVTANAANWTAGSGNHKGWKLPLPAGERVAGDGGFVSDGRFYFTSTNPTITNTSPPNGDNWLNELDYLTGSTRNGPFLDLNGDRLLNDLDRVRDGSGIRIAGAAGVPVSLFLAAGVTSQPILVQLATLNMTLFNSNPDYATTPPAGEERGVAGGHFDEDIYYRVGTGDLKKQKHFHEYDDIYDVTGVNMLNASSTTLNLSKAIPATSTRFRILVMNQYLNPAAALDVGGAGYASVKTYNDLASSTSAPTLLASLPVYTRDTIGTLKLNMPVDAFTPKDWWGNGDVRVGLIPTKPGCVNSTVNANDPNPGPLGERHDGALTIQIIKDTTPSSALELNVSGKPEYGWRVKKTSITTYVLAEYTTYWHHPNGICYGQAGWTQTPPPDTDPSDPKKYLTPAAGSDDPKVGSFRIESTGGTTSGGTTGGTGVSSSGTTGSTGGTTGSTGGTSGTGTTVTGPAGTGDVIPGVQEKRRAPRTGRVSWHEMYRN